MYQALLKKSSDNIFDYNCLMSVLSGYKAPHRKINTLLKSGDIIRVKKGLYTFGKAHRQTLTNKLLLANLIYGPSYVSHLYALAFYQLIPERVTVVTSVTPNRNKVFDTPLGQFTYQFMVALLCASYTISIVSVRI